MPAIDRRLIQNFEWLLLGLALCLVLLGVVNLISASAGQGASMFGAAWRQLTWLGVGMCGLVAVLIPDYRNLERVAIPFYLLVVGLLVAVLLTAPVIKGSQRWLVMGPLHGQPSELAKLGVILLFARLLSRRADGTELGLGSLIVPGLLLAVPAFLVLKQPDLGTTLVIGLIAASFLVVTKVRMASLAWLAGGGVAGASLAWLFYLHDYQKERLLTFLNPERDPLGSAWSAWQSQIAVGAGGLLGRGFREGSQSQYDFLPEQQTDFVFSVLAEEWGFIGAFLVVLIYVSIMLRGLLIARASKDVFGVYLALGVVALFFWAGAINIGMVLGVLPVVGVPLPFLSAGGSSLFICMVGIGLLMNISMRRYLF